MVKAVATQDIYITAYGIIDQTHHLTSEVLGDQLKIIPRDFQREKANFITNGTQIIRDLIKLILAGHPDIVHVNALRDLLFSFIAVQLAALGKKKPAIIAMSRNPQTWQNPLTSWLSAKFIRLFADGFIALATTHKDQLIRLGVPAKKLTVIPNPYDEMDNVSQVRPKNIKLADHAKRKAYILTIAHVSERKGVDLLVHAAALIIKKYPDAYFDWVGRIDPAHQAYADKVRELIRRYDIGDRFRLVGEIPFCDVKKWLVNCDIFAFPTRAEMMPRAVIEAMVAGRPVVASSVDGILDLIQNKKTGMLVRPDNPDELADAICGLLEHPLLAEKMGTAGRNYVLNYCSPEQIGRAILGFYQTISASHTYA